MTRLAAADDPEQPRTTRPGASSPHTGVRGTITPFGSRTAWPVVADEWIRGRTITLGTGERGTAVALDADAAVAALDGRLADVTDPEPPR